MVQLGGEFDSSQVEPRKAFDVLPAGWVVMQIIGSKVEPAKSNPQNKYLGLDLEMDETHHPEHKGRRVFHRLNLWNENPQAQEIAQRELSALCRATGVPKVNDSEQLHHKPIAVKLKIRPAEGQYEASNEVVGFESVAERFGTGAAAPTTPAGKPAAGGKAAAPGAPAAAAKPAPWSR